MIRSVFLRIEPFQTGDLTDKTQVEATIQAAVNSLFPNIPKIDYKTITLSAFYNKTYTLASRKRPRSESERE